MTWTELQDSRDHVPKIQAERQVRWKYELCQLFFVEFGSDESRNIKGESPRVLFVVEELLLLVRNAYRRLSKATALLCIMQSQGSHNGSAGHGFIGLKAK